MSKVTLIIGYPSEELKAEISHIINDRPYESFDPSELRTPRSFVRPSLEIALFDGVDRHQHLTQLNELSARNVMILRKLYQTAVEMVKVPEIVATAQPCTFKSKELLYLKGVKIIQLPTNRP